MSLGWQRNGFVRLQPQTMSGQNCQQEGGGLKRETTKATCLETLRLSADLMFRIWNLAPVSGLCVATLETLCLSINLAFKIWKRCACQRICCSEFGHVVAVNKFGVQNLETLCVSADLVFSVSEFLVQSLETLHFLANLVSRGTLCLSTDLVFNVSKRCACQRI